MGVALRVALVAGALIDLGVALLSLFAQNLIEPLLDIPIKDPALTLIAGGEYLVVTLVYLIVLRDPRRFRPLLWLCALDQTVAIALPLIAMAHGAFPATAKTIGPMPLQAVLVVIYLLGTRRRAGTRAKA
ncbi:MAG: hypothetical protein WCE44_14185 [Candidatus Velthaea sp.]|jgi:hypothetical protein